MTNAEAVSRCYYKHQKQHIEAAREYRKKYPERAYESVRKYQKKHRERNIFWSMIQRCYNPKSADYSLYGAKGVKVLFHTYEEFISEIGPRPSNKYSVDRIDPTGNYEHGNVRWATAKQQANNKRTKT